MPRYQSTVLAVLLSGATRSTAWTVPHGAHRAAPPAAPASFSSSAPRIHRAVLPAPLAATTDKTGEARVNSSDSKNRSWDEWLSSSAVGDLLDQVRSKDWSRLADSAQGARDSLMAGEVGQRGEVWFLAQAVCLLAILGGSVPVVGNLVLLLLGPGLLLAGLATVVISVTDMGSALSPWPVPSPVNTEGLITSGLYAQCRHPMYAGLLAACAGLAVVTDSVPRLVLTGILYVLLQAKTKVEEERLEQVFGIEYSAYQAKVKTKFVPKAVMDLMDTVRSN